MISRRHFFTCSGLGLAALGLGSGLGSGFSRAVLGDRNSAKKTDLWIFEGGHFELLHPNWMSSRGLEEMKISKFTGDYLSLIDNVQNHFEEGGNSVNAAVGEGGISILRASFKGKPQMRIVESTLSLNADNLPYISLESTARKLRG